LFRGKDFQDFQGATGRSHELNREKAKNSKGVQFWLLRTVPIFDNHQEAK